ncbi:MAG: hypothetical protein HC906_02370 [Bacteroidales bacterium]|nr:hypothetical protein [Bacteroidales bacterium]
MKQRSSYPYKGNHMLNNDLIENSWKKPGDNAEYPLLTTEGMMEWGWNNNVENPDSPSGYGDWTEDNGKTNIEGGGMHSKYLFKGDHIRLQNLQLGFSFPKKWVNRVNLSEFRIYGSATNLFTYSPYYNHFDPEGSKYRRIYELPQVKLYSLGINVIF